MFSLTELQNSKARLKTRIAEPKLSWSEDTSTGDAHEPLVVLPTATNTETSIPQPTISLNTLVTAKGSLHKVACISTTQSLSPTLHHQDDQKELNLPAFARRKEFFEKKKRTPSDTPLPSTFVVRVGLGNDTKVFTVDAKTLRKSPRFRDELRQKADLQELTVTNHSPTVFRLFLNFSENPLEPVKYQPGRYSVEPWVSNSMDAWFLAVDLGTRRFQKYALSQFIQNCAIVAKGPWGYIENQAVYGSSLSRFSRHWVAWNTFLSNWWAHEYTGLEAADLAGHVTSQTRDPRVFDIEHWYNDCGDELNPSCDHDPLAREQRRQAQVRQSRPPPAEWGSERELLARHKF